MKIRGHKYTMSAPTVIPNIATDSATNANPWRPFLCPPVRQQVRSAGQIW